MKYLKLLIVAVLSVVVIGGGTVRAQDATVDDSSIQQRLEEQGLDQAPKPVEVEEIELRGSEPYSGFVDENGNPLSDAEYEAWRKQNSKGLFKKYPWLLPVVLVAIVGGVVAGLKLKKK